MTVRGGRRRLAAGAAVLAFFVGLSVAFTWPVAARLGTHLPGGFRDSRTWVWRHWYFRERLLHGETPFFTTQVHYPTGQNLLGWDAFPLDLAATFCLQAVLRPAAAVGLYALLNFVLAGYAAYRLALGLGLARPAALVAGTVYAFNPFMSGVLHFGLCHHLATGWLPLAVLALWRLGERPPTAVGGKGVQGPTGKRGRGPYRQGPRPLFPAPTAVGGNENRKKGPGTLPSRSPTPFSGADGGRWEREQEKGAGDPAVKDLPVRVPDLLFPDRFSLRGVLLAGAALVAALSSSGYLAITAGYTLLVVGGAMLLRAAARRRLRATAARLGLAVVLALAGAAALNGPRLVETVRFRPTPMRSLDFIGEAQRFVWPRTGRAVEGPGPADVAYAPTYLGWSVLVLAALGLAVRPRRQDLAWWALLVVGLLMTLGTVLKVNGRYRFGTPPHTYVVLLPYGWLQERLPTLRNVYNTPRFLPGALVALSVLAGLGVERLGRRLRRGRAVAAVAGLVILAEGVLASPVPYPREGLPVEVPDFYRRLGDGAGRPFPVLDNSGESFAIFEAPTGRSADQFLGAMVHRRPLVNFLMDRGTRNFHEHTFERSDPLARYLQALKDPRTGRPAPWPDPPDLDLWRRLRIKYIVFHRRHYHDEEGGAARDAEVERHLSGLFGPPIDGWKSDFDEAVVFRVYDRPVALSPREQAQVLATVAEWCDHGAEYELAIRHLERAVAVVPAPDPDLHVRIARVAWALRWKRRARREVRRALEIDPDFLPARNLVMEVE